MLRLALDRETYDVILDDDGITAADLADVEILWLNEPKVALAAAEQDAIRDFVAAGGGPKGSRSWSGRCRSGTTPGPDSTAGPPSGCSLCGTEPTT